MIPLDPHALVSKVILAASRGPTQEEVFRSISDSVDNGGRSGVVGLIVMALAAIVAIVLLVASRSYRRQAAPTTLNHPGKLLKEANRSLRLRQGEIRRLKSLANQLNVTHPLVLLLCPSLLNKAMEDQRIRDSSDQR